jgi:outer membrane receptor protein involved in Fe transport
MCVQRICFSGQTATIPIILLLALFEWTSSFAWGRQAESERALPVKSEPPALSVDAASASMLEEPLNSELLLFEDIPIVVSAARQPQRVNLSAVPISAVSSADIHHGGLTRIEEVLFFVPGVDVLQIDRNRWAVGVRGLHDFTSDRTLTLIDGRAANSPLFGGSEFYRLPIFPEDIDRIEVVRGPGGAAWGPNAFNGVINVIMKEPKDVLGVLTSTTVNEFGDAYSQFRWADQSNTWSWRVSAGYEAFESSDEAISGDDFISRDFSRTTRFDTEFVNDISKTSKLSLGFGHSYLEQGPFEFLAHMPDRNGILTTTRAFSRFDHEFDDGATGYLQWFGNFARTDQQALTLYRTAENDLEAQYNFAPSGGHRLSIGGNFRHVYIDADLTNVQDLRFGDTPKHEWWSGVFLVDRWHATDRLTLEMQARADWYSETHLDWSGRATGLLALDDEKKQVLRLSAAKAFRAPLLGIRELETTRLPLPSPPFPPGLFATNVIEQPDDFENEQVYSLEAGYNAQVAEGLNFRVDAYWQRYNRLIGARTIAMGVPPQTFFQLDNLSNARAYGLETEIAWSSESARLSAWYALNDFEVEGDETVRAFLPARHKAGITGRLSLPDEWILNANYVYATTTNRSAEVDLPVPSFNRLDLTLSRPLLNGNGEVLFGVSDLFDETDLEVFGVGSISGHETPGRTYFVRLQLEF